jgi:hypothetical protein
MYFIFSALQIKYGLPEMRKGSFMMHDYNVFNKAVFKIYLAIPFLLELKTISDWTFTKTALDIF